MYKIAIINKIQLTAAITKLSLLLFINSPPYLIILYINTTTYSIFFQLKKEDFNLP